MSFRQLHTLAVLAITVLAVAPQAADAQLFGGRGLFGGPGLLPRLGMTPQAYGPGYYNAGAAYSGCGECGTSYTPATYATASTACNPCAVAAAPVAVSCTYAQPVQETVYKEVPVVKYRSVQKTARRPVYKTAYEERDVTVYKTINEQKTVEVPFTTYQTVQSCQTAQVDRSRWQTTYVPTQRVSPCQYDSRSGFMGWMNRTGYEIRSAFTPRYVARRQYVPNVQTVAYPVTQQVPITATRQVTYNVAKVVPTTEKRQVAVMKLDYEDVTYTAQEPYTQMQTVAVGTQTRYAMIGTQGTTATAAAPTPATQSASQRVRPKTAKEKTPSRSASGSSPFQLNSYEPEPEAPTYDGLQVQLKPVTRGWTSNQIDTPTLRVAGWRTASDSKSQSKPQVSVAAAGH